MRFALPLLAVVFLGAQPANKGLVSGDGEKTELVVQDGHHGRVMSAVFTSDGRKILAGGLDNTVRLWDVQDGRLLRTFVHDGSAIRTVAISADGMKIASGSFNGSIKVWQSSSGKLLATFLGHSEAVTSLSFSSNGAFVVSGSSDKTIRIWNESKPSDETILKGHLETITAIAISPDGTHLASGGLDKTIRVWNVLDRKLLKILNGHNDQVNSLAFSMDGHKIVSGAYDQTIKIWDLDSDGQPQTLQGHSGSVGLAAFLPGSSKVISTSADKTIKIWNATDGTVLQTFQNHSDTKTCFAISRDGQKIACDQMQLPLQIWDIYQEKIIRSFPTHSVATFIALSSADTSRIIAAGDRTIAIWNSTPGVPLKLLTGHAHWIRSISLLKGDEILASGSEDKTIRVWDVKNNSLKVTFPIQSESVLRVAFSPNGKILASASSAGENSVKLWSYPEGKLLKTLEGKFWIQSLAFAPNNSKIIVTSDNRILEWDTSTGKFIRSFEGHSSTVSRATFSLDGRFIASAGNDKTIRIWDTAKGTLLRTIAAHDSLVTNVNFSPDGRQLISASDDRTLKIWDVTDGNLSHTLRGHLDRVESGIFSTDGMKIISAGYDGRICVWLASSGLHLATLITFNDGTGLVYTPDGRFDVTDEAAKRYVSYRQSDRFFDLVDIQKKYRVKGLLKKVLDGTLDEPESRIEKDAKGLPKVQIKYPDPEAASRIFTSADLSDDKFPLKFVPLENGGGLSTVEIRNHDRLVKVVENIESGKAIDVDVPLFNGVNRVTINVKNKREIGAPETVQIEYKGKPITQKPTLYFLAVGVNTYSGTNKLNYARADAEAMAAAIKKYGEGLGGKEKAYEKVVIHTLYDDKAFKKAIKDKVKEITKAAGSEDVIMLYFSGHGASVAIPGTKHRFYAYLPQDFSFGGVTYDTLLNEGVHGEFLEEQLSLQNTKAKKVVLILDTCQSGDVLSYFVAKKSGQENDTAVLSDLVAGSGIFVLASSAGEQVSRESDKIKHGVFTQVLLEGLQDKKADSNDNGIVTVVELGNYLRTNVDRKLKEVFGEQEKQIPRIVEMGRDSFGEAYNDFPLASVR